MKNEGMTALQREALEHLGKARQQGLSISAYARAHGIPAQRIFDAVARLRRRGALPDQSVKRGKFIAVKIAAPRINDVAVCRLLMPGGLSIECCSGRRAAWLERLTRAPDAAS